MSNFAGSDYGNEPETGRHAGLADVRCPTCGEPVEGWDHSAFTGYSVRPCGHYVTSEWTVAHIPAAPASQEVEPWRNSGGTPSAVGFRREQPGGEAT